jgi:hypothetical protein
VIARIGPAKNTINICFSGRFIAKPLLRHLYAFNYSLSKCIAEVTLGSIAHSHKTFKNPLSKGWEAHPTSFQFNVKIKQ